MRTLRILEHISLDGVIEIGASNDPTYPHGNWTADYRSADGTDAVLTAQGEHFDLLLGRRTYDIWSRYWPTAPSSPMSDRLNAATKYVVTHRPETLKWGPFEAVGANFLESVRRMKSQGDRDLILWGSSTLTSALLEHGLADEIVLFVYPVLLGTGKRLFAEGTPPRAFEPIGAHGLGSGVVRNLYKVTGPLKHQS